MGYSTDFKGVLRFTSELTVKELSFLNSFLGQDLRDHPEWKSKTPDLSYLDLALTNNFTGIEWNGAEKTYHMVEAVNFIIEQMQKVNPKFGLYGELKAQGEDPEDRWILIIDKDGIAKKVETPPKGIKVKCPSCGERFYVEQ